MKRLLALPLAALLFTASCGIAEDDTAASVFGKDISVKEVDELARTDFVKSRLESTGAGLVSSTNGTTGSESRRFALNLLVQTVAMEEAVERRGGEITSEDLATADDALEAAEQQAQQAGSSESLEPTVKALFRRNVAAESALRRMNGADESGAAPSDADIEAYFEEHADEFGEVTCVDGFAVPEAQAGAAQVAVDRGDDVSAVLADSALGAQSLSQTGEEVCVGPEEIAEPVLAELVNTGAIGVWGTGSLEGPTGMLTVFVLPSFRGPATPELPSIRAQIETAIQEAAAAELQADLTEYIASSWDSPDIEIDPRYGSWDRSVGNVLAPPTPRLSAKASATPSSEDLLTIPAS